MATQDISHDPKGLPWHRYHGPSSSKTCALPLRNMNDFNAGELKECEDRFSVCCADHDHHSALCRAIALSSLTAETALNALDKLAPCIWPRLVHAQAEIESLRSELRAAREGEERAYEALKRLRTRENTRTRSSSRARMLVENGASAAQPERSATDASSPTQDMHTKLSENISPFKDVHGMDTQAIEERIAARASKGAEKLSKPEKLRWNSDTSFDVSVQESLAQMQADHDALYRQISERDKEISQLLSQLQEERLKTARHRDVAATVTDYLNFCV